MHRQSHSELQGVSPQRTSQNRALRSSRLRRGSGHLHLHAERGALLWVWLLLGSLAVPGAWSFLSEEQEELLVELHNHYRGQVSPSAAAMMPLKWDAGLKLTAEVYAAKCIWNHNPELEDTGENLFVGTGPLDIAAALEKWFLEHLDYDFHNNSCDEDKMCGHYTQMVWADTHKVGCAFHNCSTMEGLDWKRVSFLVCNYYPAGNYEGERPYVEGDWCSSCPENLQNCENNLCVANTEEEEEEVDDEVGTAAPPITLKASVRPEEEEKLVPDVQPPPTTAPSVSIVPSVSSVHSVSTLSSTTTTMFPKSTTEALEDMPEPTFAVDTHPSHGSSTTQREDMYEENEGEEAEIDTMEKTVKEKKLDTAQIIHPHKDKNSASILSPSLLSAALMVILVLTP